MHVGHRPKRKRLIAVTERDIPPIKSATIELNIDQRSELVRTGDGNEAVYRIDSHQQDPSCNLQAPQRSRVYRNTANVHMST